MKTCDVLIVGGGPAGLSVASSLGNNISSIVVHQDMEIGKPVRTSGGSFLKDIERLCPNQDIYQVIDKLDYFSDNAEARFDIETDKMVILDVTKLYKHLASLSDDKPRELLLGTKYISTVKEDGFYTSTLRLRDGEKQQVKSKYIIDASGWHCAVTAPLGLVEKPERLGIGTEYEFVQKDYPMNRAILFVGSHVLSGYGWVFPTNYGTVRLGVGVIKPDTDDSPRDVMQSLLDSGFLDKLGVKVPEDYEVNSGILPSEPFDQNVVFGNIIRVGDSANCATPVAGEGIRIAIEQGRSLGALLSKAIEINSDRPLDYYEKAYAAKYARDYRIGFWANQRIARYTPADWDKSVKRLAKMDEVQMTELLRSRFSLKSILRTVILHLKRKLFG